MTTYDDFTVGDGVEIIMSAGKQRHAYFSGRYRGFYRNPKGGWAMVVRCKPAPYIKPTDHHVPTSRILSYRHHPNPKASAGHAGTADEPGWDGD